MDDLASVKSVYIFLVNKLHYTVCIYNKGRFDFAEMFLEYEIHKSTKAKSKLLA